MKCKANPNSVATYVFIGLSFWIRIMQLRKQIYIKNEQLNIKVDNIGLSSLCFFFFAALYFPISNKNNCVPWKKEEVMNTLISQTMSN
jgi:hypothetical protein